MRVSTSTFSSASSVDGTDASGSTEGGGIVDSVGFIVCVDVVSQGSGWVVGGVFRPTVMSLPRLCQVTGSEMLGIEWRASATESGIRASWGGETERARVRAES